MSEQQETIRWTALTDKEKVRLLLEKIMGCFALEETAKGYHSPAFPKSARAPGFHWPIAFWNTDCDCWAYKDIGDNNANVFDPLHDLNDAWKVVEHLDMPLDLHRYKTPDTQEQWAYYVTIGEGKRIVDATARTSQEAICIAALRYMGVLVDTSSPPPTVRQHQLNSNVNPPGGSTTGWIDIAQLSAQPEPDNDSDELQR